MHLQYAGRNKDDDDDELGHLHYNDMQFYLLFFRGINHIWDEKKNCIYVNICVMHITYYTAN